MRGLDGRNVIVTGTIAAKGAALLDEVSSIAVMCPFSNSSPITLSSFSMTLMFALCVRESNIGLWRSLLLLKATRMTGVEELRNPNTMMKISGNRKLKITAEGLRNMPFRLALAMASMAVN